MTKYSVLMSVYKNVTVGELKLSINSVLNQTLPADQIIIVIDGPVDHDLKNCISDYCTKNPGVFTIVPLGENHGLAFALNEGIMNSRNELIARMDSDDYSLPERCEKQIKSFEADEDLILLGTQVGYFQDTIENLLSLEKNVPCTQKEIRKYIRRNDPFGHPTVMYKKSAVLKAGGYDPSLRRRQDYDLFSRMVTTYSMKSANLPDKLLLFRADENYIERNRNKETCNSRIEVHKRILKRGECSIVDFLYVYFAMKVSLVLPSKLYSTIYSILKK